MKDADLQLVGKIEAKAKRDPDSLLGWEKLVLRSARSLEEEIALQKRRQEEEERTKEFRAESAKRLGEAQGYLDEIMSQINLIYVREPSQPFLSRDSGKPPRVVEADFVAVVEERARTPQTLQEVRGPMPCGRLVNYPGRDRILELFMTPLGERWDDVVEAFEIQGEVVCVWHEHGHPPHPATVVFRGVAGRGPRPKPEEPQPEQSREERGPTPQEILQAAVRGRRRG